MEHEVWYKYPQAVNHLPDMIHFVTSEQLLDLYPELTPKERENAITRELGCVFVMKIGAVMRDGQKHDGRAPDYDDWDLNGDILFWYEPLQQALEISSMGIRVDEESLHRQLEAENCLDREALPFHQAVLNAQLPYTIGGGIGQSRLCMLLLKKAHVGKCRPVCGRRKCGMPVTKPASICCNRENCTGPDDVSGPVCLPGRRSMPASFFFSAAHRWCRRSRFFFTNRWIVYSSSHLVSPESPLSVSYGLLPLSFREVLSAAR